MYLLDKNLQASANHTYSRWSDKNIILGEDWAGAIARAIEAADFGLLLISSSFLASPYIATHELAKFVDASGQLRPGKRIIPVAIKPINEFMDMKGLQHRQIFFHDKKTFFECKNASEKYQFALELHAKIELACPPPAIQPSASKPLTVLPGHKDVVHSVAFSPDDKYILSASADKTICLWEISTWRCLKPFVGHTEAVFSAAFSDDGTLIVSASADKTVRIWDRVSRNCLKILKADGNLPADEGEFRSANFHPDGKQVVAVDNTGMIRLWDWESGTPINENACGDDILNWATFSHDGTKILVASSDSTAYLWDAQLSKMLYPFEDHTGPIKQVAFSRKNDRLLTVASNGTMRIWNLADKTHLEIKTNHTEPINSACFSFNEKYIISASSDQTLQLWNSLTGDYITTFNGHTGEVMSVAFSHGNHPAANQYFISAGRDNTIRLWDVNSQQLLHTCQTASGKLAAIGIARSGEQIVSSDEKWLRLWKQSTGICEDESPINGILEVAISDDGKYFATVGERYQIRIWTALNKSPITLNRGGDNSEICGLAFAPDGKWLASFGTDCTIQLWAIHNGQPQPTYKLDLGQNIDSLLGINFDSNGEHILLIADNENNLRLWNCATCKWRLEVFQGHTDKINSAFISSDKKHIVTASTDKTIRYWSIATAKCLKTIDRQPAAVHCAKFSPDGTQIISVSDGALRIWNTTTQDNNVIRINHKAKIIHASFTADGEQIFFASIDGSWQLYDIPTRKLLLEVWQFRDGHMTLDRETNQVTASHGNALLYLE